MSDEAQLSAIGRDHAADLARLLAGQLPPQYVAPAVTAAGQIVAAGGDLAAVLDALSAVVPPQYRVAMVAGVAVAQLIARWLDEPIRVQAGSVTIRDERP